MRPLRSDGRRGLALLTVFWWILGTFAILLLAHVWTLNRSRIERKTFRATDHFHAAEAVLERELARLKAFPWRSRWYADPTASRDVSGIQGEFDYVARLEDVGDHWTDPTLASGRILEDHTDIFLRLTHSRGTTEITTSCHFLRTVFLHPTPTRPTAFVVRRSVRTGIFDPASATDRRAVLERINQEEADREARRPVSEVHEMEFREAHRRDPALSTRDLLAGLDRTHMQAQIGMHRLLVTSLTNGKREMIDPSRNASGPRYLEAVTHFLDAFARAQSECGHLQRYTLARTQYALAAAEWALARTSPMCSPRCSPPSLCPRHTQLAAVSSRLDVLMGESLSYPWIPDPVAADSAPVRFEAPHAFVMAAFLRASLEDPHDPLRYAVAIGEAQILLRTMRDRYPGFHLWGEDAVTGQRRGNDPPLVEDELTWYLERLLTPPIMAVGGTFSAGSPAGPRISRRIFRWSPGAVMTPQPGRWIEEAALDGERTGAMVAPLEACSSGSGRFVGGRLLIAGGRGPDGKRAVPDAEIYDPFTRTLHPVAASLGDARSQAASVPVSGTGAILVIGGHDPEAGPAAPVISTERFDPASETFVTNGAWALQLPHPHPRAVQVAGGRILSVDGRSGQTFECVSGSCGWTSVSNNMATDRNFASLVALDTGNALVAGGGLETVSVTASCDVYVASTSPPRFCPTGSAPPDDPVPVGTLIAPRWHAWAVRLDTFPEAGKVVVGNGVSTPDPAAPGSNGLEIFDPVTGQSMPLNFAGNPVLTGGIGSGRRAIGLGGNAILITGGRQGGGSENVTEVLRYVDDASQVLPQPALPDGLDAVSLVEVR